MPELAEVEYMRKQWNIGINLTVSAVSIHDNNVFKSCDTTALRKLLPGCRLLSSAAAAKQMLFVFEPGNNTKRKGKSSGDGNTRVYLGVHLGMTGRLIACDGKGQTAARNENWEHLVLHMQGSSSKVQVALVFSDFRMFGRVMFHAGESLPEWWTSIAPAIDSSDFTRECVAEFMKRRAGITVKAALLMQERFPGIGNWMADEILWRACIHPSRRCGDLSDEEVTVLHSVCVWVCKQAMSIIGSSFADPPPTWLYHYRWQDGGKCPLTGTALQRETIGGRTSCFCPSRQKMKGGGPKHVFLDESPSATGSSVKSSAWKAQAAASSKTTDVSSLKHGKKRSQAVPEHRKVKDEDEVISSSVSPWGKQVRKGNVKVSSAKVKSETNDAPRTKRIKVEEHVVFEETQPVVKKAQKKKENKKLVLAPPPFRQQRQSRVPAVKAEIVTLTERQQMLQLIRESQQEQVQPLKHPKSKKQPPKVAQTSAFKVKREV